MEMLKASIDAVLPSVPRPNMTIDVEPTVRGYGILRLSLRVPRSSHISAGTLDAALDAALDVVANLEANERQRREARMERRKMSASTSPSLSPLIAAHGPRVNAVAYADVGHLDTGNLRVGRWQIVKPRASHIRCGRKVWGRSTCGVSSDLAKCARAARQGRRAALRGRTLSRREARIFKDGERNQLCS